MKKEGKEKETYKKRSKEERKYQSAFSKTRHISIILIELSLINILAPPSECGSTFRVIMIT
jgi:hypothetical protein